MSGITMYQAAELARGIKIAPEPIAKSAVMPRSQPRAGTATGRDGWHTSSSEFEIISDRPAFGALESEWNQLQASNPHHQLAFQSHAWLRAWFDAYGAGDALNGKVAIVTARTDGKLSVICPLLIRRRRGLRILGWLGEPASQYGDALTDGSAFAGRALADALDYAVAVLQPDLVQLRKVRDDAAVNAWLREAGAVRAATGAAPYLDFRSACSFDAYCARYSAKARKNRRRLRRRLAEAGPVTTTILSCGSKAAEAILTGIAFKQAWLVQRGHISSALRDRKMSAFLRGVAGRPNATAEPFVSIMHCGETPVSVQFGILSNNRLALHMIAYNPETEKAGAGVLHLEDTIRHCIEQGWHELDFLAPDAPYKRAWADDARTIADFVVPLSRKGRLYSRAYVCSTRKMLKHQLDILPLKLRQTIAGCLQRLPSND
ncbi:MAG: GNAT family N-acetyltransferase [Alphaproteobacteria bacterium]|nr:GNAT family N-acetyltransferase [Alphaproteobacteria bacterium]